MKSERDMLPFSVIVLAVEGGVDANNIVLLHFEHYIIRLSQKLLFDEFGNSHIYIDEDIKHLLESKLITAILNFKLN